MVHQYKHIWVRYESQSAHHVPFHLLISRSSPHAGQHRKRKGSSPSTTNLAGGLRYAWARRRSQQQAFSSCGSCGSRACQQQSLLRTYNSACSASCAPRASGCPVSRPPRGPCSVSGRCQCPANPSHGPGPEPGPNPAVSCHYTKRRVHVIIPTGGSSDDIRRGRRIGSDGGHLSSPQQPQRRALGWRPSRPQPSPSAVGPNRQACCLCC